MFYDYWQGCAVVREFNGCTAAETYLAADTALLHYVAAELDGRGDAMASAFVGAEYHALVTADDGRTVLDVQVGFAHAPALLYHDVDDIAVGQRKEL